MSELTLPDDIYFRIMTAMGYPIVTEEELGVTREQIEDLLILPALKNVYFKWFPKQEFDSHRITTQFDIDFPDEFTWGIIDLRLNTNPYWATQKTGNPLINEMSIKISSGGYNNMWNSGNDYGYSAAEYSQRALRQSVVDTYKGFKKTIDYKNRKVTGYTNVSGELSITWAKFSYDWADVDFRFEEDTIKLAQSYVLQYFGQIRNQINTNNADELDGGDLIDRAETLYSEVMEAWRGYPKVTILRG
jgi:hypothetical protein